MAHFQTTLDTPASPKLAFEYLADFSNARLWDPGVSAGRRLDAGPIGEGSRFEIELDLAGTTSTFEYVILHHEPDRRLVLQAETPRIRSLDTITIEPRRDGGSRVGYDADLRAKGALHALDLPLHLAFQVIGARAARGLERALAKLA